jgi:hypothetical protein
MKKQRRRRKAPMRPILSEPLQSVAQEVQRLGQLRFQFKQLRDNATYCVELKEWMIAVRALAGSNPTPEQWVEAARKAKTKCDVCKGSGVYRWGASINGVMQHSGPCFRCESKGYQGQADYVRNRIYDNHRRVI